MPTLDDLRDPSPIGPEIVYREVVLQPRTDMQGRECLAAYDRETDMLFVNYVKS